LYIFTLNRTIKKAYSQNSGKYGELLAKKYLIKNGYEILTTNYRSRFGEIDIIAKDKKELVFVEVKYSESIENPYLRVDKNKMKRIIKTAYYFLNDYNDYDSVRFDVISIFKNKIEHFKSVLKDTP
jgi:putative endonuclease